MNEQSRIQQAQRVTLVGFVANLVLSGLKIVAGIVGQSAAMLADGLHSLSDFVTDAVVIIFIRISGKASDTDHTYGHGKYETFATLMISLALFGVGAMLLYNGVVAIVGAIGGEPLPEPSLLALGAAALSIVVKEILFQYTRYVGRRIASPAVIANGWHHRSDAVSSIATAVGIAGAIFLGSEWRVLDPIAGLLVSIFIIKVAYDLARPCIGELLEQSLPADICKMISENIMNNKQVISYHKLKTRRIGNAVAIDVHIILDKNLSFVEAHNVTEEIEKSLYNSFDKQELYINIHAEPNER
ncbi:MAG: cation transporter [Bacteroidales bacterium]|nr:cation transporter [Bacteroidales bacterium]